MGISIAGDEEKDRRTIIQQFMRELCRRDDEVNRGHGTSNVFSIAEIRDEALGAFDLGYVSQFIRGYEMEDDPDIRMVDTEHVTLTDKGRDRCGEFGL